MHLRVQGAGGQEDRIANLFGFETAAGEVRQVLILGIFFAGVHAAVGGLAVSRGEQYHAVELFDTPAFFDEFQGEPIEEFRMTGSGATGTVVASRRDNATTEVVLPDAIHHDPCGEGIVGTGDPFRQPGAAAGG